MLLFHSSAVELAAVFLSVTLAITVHEFAHAWRADLAGDPTPRAAGRLTLNPIAHFDPIGSLLFLIVGFGWAKPVPVNPLNFRHPRRDGIHVALWGPLSNFLIAAAAGLAIRVSGIRPEGGVGIFLYVLTLLNLNLGMFNLMPLPPLDGSHILSGMLDSRRAYAYEMWSRRYGLFILFAFLYVGFAYLYKFVVFPLYRLLTGL